MRAQVSRYAARRFGTRYARSSGPCSASQARSSLYVGRAVATAAQNAAEWSWRMRWQSSWTTTYVRIAGGARIRRQLNDSAPVFEHEPQRVLWSRTVIRVNVTPRRGASRSAA